MASTVTIKLTEPECEHLLALLDQVRVQGDYYGPQKQYWARHARIETKLESAQRKANPDGH